MPNVRFFLYNVKVTPPREVAPSEPFHDVQIFLSEETRPVANCIMAWMVQLMMRLLSSPEHAPAEQVDLYTLLQQETAAAISERGYNLPSDSRDLHQRPYHPTDF